MARFLTDEMLGSLTKWLRMCGFDTLYAKGLGLDDNGLLLKAHDSKRVLLTRDVELSKRARGVAQCVLLTSTRVEGQLKEVATALKVKLPTRPVGRFCTECNGLLECVALDNVKKDVPASLRSHPRKFWRCASCRRVYWAGSHWKRIEKALQELN